MTLPGAKDVKIEAGKKPATQKVTLVADKGGITKDEAVKSLGTKASRFVVKKWADPTAAKPKKAKES